MEFIYGVLASPFVLVGALWAGLAWWAWILFVAGLVATEACVYNEKDGWGFFWLAVTAILVSYILVPDTDSSFLGEVSVAIKMAFVGLVDYVILGLVAAIPLWLWCTRKNLVALRSKLYDYVQQCGKTKKHWKQWNLRNGDEDVKLLDAEQVETCQNYRSGGNIPNFLKEDWAEFRRYNLNIPDGANKVANNVDTITGYVFLWPFHYITMFFGDFLARIPEWFVRYFGRLIDSFARIVRVGIPSGIDD